MFGKRAESKPQAKIDSLIGAGTRVEGNVIFSGGLRIDGTVRGDVLASDGASSSMVVLSEQGRIEGMLRVDHLVSNGQIVGPVEAGVSLELLPKARIVGDVAYQMIEMHQGAVIEGRLRLRDSTSEPTSVVAD